VFDPTKPLCHFEERHAENYMLIIYFLVR